jgi:hypothetical protein
MVAYADTSFLVSLYSRDANGGPAHEMAGKLSEPLAFTPFLRHEARNALRIAVSRKGNNPRRVSVSPCRHRGGRQGGLARGNARFLGGGLYRSRSPERGPRRETWHPRFRRSACCGGYRHTRCGI